MTRNEHCYCVQHPKNMGVYACVPRRTLEDQDCILRGRGGWQRPTKILKSRRRPGIMPNLQNDDECRNFPMVLWDPIDA